jgi:hypothetical protein
MNTVFSSMKVASNQKIKKVPIRFHQGARRPDSFLPVPADCEASTPMKKPPNRVVSGLETGFAIF